MTPADLGVKNGGVMERFEVSLLTEGSGTQIYSTTFVQWAAREALRRAQPLTMLVRFAPRERERPMNELLEEAQRTSQLDPAGSLVDADMGAYYTWLNQRRLTEAERSSFLVWFEDHAEAVAIGPKLARGSVEERPVENQGAAGKDGCVMKASFGARLYFAFCERRSCSARCSAASAVFPRRS